MQNNLFPTTEPSLQGPKGKAGPFSLPALPYDENALEPVISARTVRYHYGKHHKGYVDTLNDLVKGTDFADMKLEELIKSVAGDRTKEKIFNNAAQAWNHAFYWKCLSPAPSAPSKSLQEAITRDFGGLSEIKAALEEKADNRFGSGWAWLIRDKNRLSIVDTINADTPIARGATCLLAIDVWEHAYYLDYQNDRKAHVAAVIDKCLDWGFASTNFERAAG